MSKETTSMRGSGPTAEMRGRQAIWDFLARNRLGKGRQKVNLVSYPRSGSTLAREYFAILQGRAQLSVYAGDVVNATGAALTSSLDNFEVIKGHGTPADEGPMIYLVRDGRNATLSFLYMSFLFGGHRFTDLADVCEGIRHLDAAEGSWADHVAQALKQSELRPTLFVRYEDLVREPPETLARMTRFMNAEISADVLNECALRQKASDAYTANPHNGYLYEPAPGSIYDILKRHRRDDYWRHIFDDRSKRHFHERGGTPFLLHFKYEHSTEWWKE